MSANVAYWEKELNEATLRLKGLEREQDQMNPLVHEQLRQKREDEIKVCAAQLHLAQENQAQ
jgi:hypothetical protein